jgi:O-acetyl-ADP-ribose deacetylase (regulator of RNase III)
MPFSIVRDDITKMRVDAIVNAANTRLQMGGGVCGAIFRAAGEAALQEACDRIGGCETGKAVITPGFHLPAKFVIHTPGPVWQGGTHGEEALLRGCYLNSLRLAAENGLNSIAFPLISSGIYGYPKHSALKVATVAIRDFLNDHDMDIFLALFDKAALHEGNALFGPLEAFIDQRYVDAHTPLARRLLDAERLYESEAPHGLSEEPSPCAAPMAAGPPVGIDRAIGRLDEPFAKTLLRLIDGKGMSDVEVYKRANLDRRLFSKIRSNPLYMPGKRTVLALSVALELSPSEAEDLLKRAGFALSRSQKLDVIVEYFLREGRYDIFEINETLFYYDQPLLGS